MNNEIKKPREQTFLMVDSRVFITVDKWKDEVFVKFLIIIFF